MTLKTNKHWRKRLLFQAEANAKAGEYTLVSEGDLQDLCHDADRAEELEKLLDTYYSPAHMQAVEDRTIQPLRKEIADLRAKLDDVEAIIQEITECPITPDEATYGPQGINAAPPHQAVVVVSCSWTRWKKLRAALKEKP